MIGIVMQHEQNQGAQPNPERVKPQQCLLYVTPLVLKKTYSQIVVLKNDFFSLGQKEFKYEMR